VNIFEETLNPSPTRGLVVDVATMDDDEINVQTRAETGIHEATGDSFTEFTRNFAAAVGLKGSRLGFTAALKAKYSSSITRSTTTKYMRISDIITGHNVSIGTDPYDFKDWLTPEFKDALKRQTAEEMFKEYGTHVAMTVEIGGSAYYSCHSVETESLTEQDFSFSARAGYKSKGGSIDGTTTLTRKEIESLKNVLGCIPWRGKHPNATE
jgi:hypothetical protein